ncbi:hypothetical protein ACQP2P_39635 [Dactylosporangium sp. CA-139114]|uniref:hypothetical protein n=1 Tax=Dactylosporangium sp. CA-139114 TaxID=3239931 RepID=UPI003D98D967
MTAEYLDQTFEHKRIEHGTDAYDGSTFRRCTFFGCTIRPRGGDGFISVGAGLTFDRCAFGKNVVNQIVLRDWMLSSYRASSQPLFLTSCLFDRVRFSGKCGATSILGPQPSVPPVQKSAILQAAAEFYGDIEWAVDIRDASFTDIKLLFVPGELVLRDPQRHFLVYRDRLESVAVELLPSAIQSRLELVGLSPFSSVVMVAPDKGRNAAEVLAGYRALVEMGVAE